MYKAYVKEKENLETYENEYGFGAYHIDLIARTMEIGDFYIKPEFRNGRYSSKLLCKLESIAVSKGCSKLLCGADLKQNKPEESLYMIIRHGFKYSHLHNQVIYFIKELH